MRLFQPAALPWLRYVETPGTPGGGTATPPAPLTDEQFLEQNGFPRGTSTDDMTDAQKAAYWRNESKKHQADAAAKGKELGKWAGLGEFDTVSTTLSTFEQERQKNLTDAQRAQEDAAKAAQTAEAAALAAARAKYLPATVAAQVVALTRQPNETPEDAQERVNSALQFVDVNRFVDDNGDLDTNLIQTFAQSIAPKDGNVGNDQSGSLSTLLGRQSQAPKGSGGSVADARTRAYEARTTKK